MLFRDRFDAGQHLGLHLRQLITRKFTLHGPPLVLGLARGGVPVAFEVALALNAPLDVFVVRKLGTPGQEELAMGAIASGGLRVVNQEVVEALNIAPDQVDAIAAREAVELERRETQYRGNRGPLEVSGRSVLLVDDGLATGYSMRAAVAALRRRSPAEIIVAVPVGTRSTCEEIQAEADAVVCLDTPPRFMAVGQFYRRFEQTTDQEVRDLIDRAADRPLVSQGPHGAAA